MKLSESNVFLREYRHFSVMNFSSFMRNIIGIPRPDSVDRESRSLPTTPPPHPQVLSEVCLCVDVLLIGERSKCSFYPIFIIFSYLFTIKYFTCTLDVDWSPLVYLSLFQIITKSLAILKRRFYVYLV